MCGNLSALPSSPLLLLSTPWLWSFPAAHPPSPSVKGLPRVWKLFLLHSSLPEVQVPSLFFVSVFSFFFCPIQVRGEFLAFWEVWGLLPAFSRCSVGVVPHVDVFVGRKVISTSYSSAILKVSHYVFIFNVIIDYFVLGLPFYHLFLFLFFSLPFFYFLSLLWVIGIFKWFSIILFIVFLNGHHFV